jgi:hypothetical protein
LLHLVVVSLFMLSITVKKKILNNLLREFRILYYITLSFILYFAHTKQGRNKVPWNTVIYHSHCGLHLVTNVIATSHLLKDVCEEG